MLEKLLATIIMVISSITDVNGYGSGAPHGACYDLEPQHYGVLPKDPKQNPNPYTVETLQGDYLFSPGREIQFRIYGHKFRGLIFQVRDELGRSRGKFTSLNNQVKTITCRHPDDTLTHTTPEVKTELTFTWRAPDNARHQVLYLSGTIAESESSFWSDKVVVLYNSLFTHEFDDENGKSDL